MANRDVNKVMLIGNLTRDPEIRYTPQGTAVANFTVATNRNWVYEGVEKEAVDFHNVVSWNKLAEICGQLLQKGSKVYVEGRLQTRDWIGNDGQKKYKTEVNIDEMILLARGKMSSGNQGTDYSQASGQDSNDSSSANANSDDNDDLDLDKILEEIEVEEKEESKSKDKKKGKK